MKTSGAFAARAMAQSLADAEGHPMEVWTGTGEELLDTVRPKAEENKPTYRERRQKRAEKLRDWSGKAETRAQAAFGTADSIAGGMTPGQPILVGHHSEKRHRRDLGRIDSNMRKGFEEKDKAERHASKAKNIEAQLKSSIYDDDPDALEALRERISRLEAERERIKKINAYFRKAAKRAGIKPHNWDYARGRDPETRQKALDVLADAFADDSIAITQKEREDLMSGLDYSGQIGFPGYHLQNLGGNINRNKKRLVRLEREQV